MIVVIGMDPGPTPGMVRLTYSDARLVDMAVVQCTANTALDVLQMWLITLPRAAAETYFGVEQYVDRQRGRSGTAGARTRDLVGSAMVLAQTHGAHPVQRPAVTVKAWATDVRLNAAGLLPSVKGMTHAKDGARHALYAACKDALIPDPLSRKAKRDG